MFLCHLVPIVVPPLDLALLQCKVMVYRYVARTKNNTATFRKQVPASIFRGRPLGSSGIRLPWYVKPAC